MTIPDQCSNKKGKELARCIKKHSEIEFKQEFRSRSPVQLKLVDFNQPQLSSKYLKQGDYVLVDNAEVRSLGRINKVFKNGKVRLNFIDADMMISDETSGGSGVTSTINLSENLEGIDMKRPIRVVGILKDDYRNEFKQMVKDLFIYSKKKEANHWKRLAESGESKVPSWFHEGQTGDPGPYLKKYADAIDKIWNYQKKQSKIISV